MRTLGSRLGLLLLLLLLAGCQSVEEEPARCQPLGLSQDRYVLPPDPPPPEPRPTGERLALEAEWPPVWPLDMWVPESGVLRVRYAGNNRPYQVSALESSLRVGTYTPRSPTGGAQPPSQTQAPTLLRVVPSRHASPPRLILEAAADEAPTR